MPLNSLHVWLDANIELNLSREAVEAVEKAIRAKIDPHRGLLNSVGAELETAANIIRAHLHHLPPKGIPLHHVQCTCGFATATDDHGHEPMCALVRDSDPLLS